MDYCKGDICLTVDCGNLAHPETRFCTDCVPVPRKPSITVRCIRFVLKQVLNLFHIE